MLRFRARSSSARSLTCYNRYKKPTATSSVQGPCLLSLLGWRLDLVQAIETIRPKLRRSFAAGILSLGGVCMPARAWAEFLDVYYRPHLIVVNLETPVDSTSGKLVDLLRRLVEGLQSTADYALFAEKHEIKIAFERDLDAEVVRGLLKASLLEIGGAEWASRSVCVWES